MTLCHNQPLLLGCAAFSANLQSVADGSFWPGREVVIFLTKEAQRLEKRGLSPLTFIIRERNCLKIVECTEYTEKRETASVYLVFSVVVGTFFKVTFTTITPCCWAALRVAPTYNLMQAGISSQNAG